MGLNCEEKVNAVIPHESLRHEICFEKKKIIIE